MGAKPKFYVVWKGRKPGLYFSWEDCQKQVDKFTGARYKSFETEIEAKNALLQGPVAVSLKKIKAKPKTDKTWNPNSVSVDAACSGNPGAMEYRCVETQSGKPLFHSPVFTLGTNNIGEFLAIVHALGLYHEAHPALIIYTDSRTALAWLKKGKVKTTLERNASTETLFNLMARAEKWLATHTWKNPVLKWNTENWGEIPADFGRK